MRTVVLVVVAWLALSLPATLLVCMLCRGGRRAEQTIPH
jgi:hypothetical protein